MPNVETMSTPRSALPNAFNNITAREMDFVTQFEKNWDSLREVMGIARPVKKEDGSILRTFTASVELEDGKVPAGAVIPYSKATVTEATKGEITLEKYAKAVTIEDVTRYGAEVAVQKTDDAFKNELQTNVLDRFYDFLKEDEHALGKKYGSFQMAVSMAIGLVRDKFKKMRKDISSIVVFVNTLDVYEYLGAANVSMQTLNGLEYLKNFLGATTMIVSSEIDRGTVIAVPSSNMVLYYIDPSSADIKKLGLNYVVSGETNLIGFHANGNYSTAVGESFATMGLQLWYEYADGVAINTFDVAEDDGEEGGDNSNNNSNDNSQGGDDTEGA